MWKGHTLEVHCANNNKKVSSSNEIILHKVKKNWVWENFREDYTTLALFAGIKGTIWVTILIVSQTLKFEMYYYLMHIFSLNVGAMDF